MYRRQEAENLWEEAVDRNRRNKQAYWVSMIGGAPSTVTGGMMKIKEKGSCSTLSLRRRQLRAFPSGHVNFFDSSRR